MAKKLPAPLKRPRWVAYYRVSTGAQGRSGLGLDAQRETVKRYRAAEGGGWPPLQSYTETEPFHSYQPV